MHMHLRWPIVMFGFRCCQTNAKMSKYFLRNVLLSFPCWSHGNSCRVCKIIFPTYACIFSILFFYVFSFTCLICSQQYKLALLWIRIEQIFGHCQVWRNQVKFLHQSNGPAHYLNCTCPYSVHFMQIYTKIEGQFTWFKTKQQDQNECTKK